MIGNLAGCTSLHAQYNTDEQRANFYLEISKKYTRAAYEILKSDSKQEFVTYGNNGKTTKDLLSRYGTVVHETCHGYNFDIGLKSSWGNNGFFITENIQITARKGSYFPSSKLNSVVPKEQQEKIFRYSTYVSGASYNSASTEGVYGFLDEFSAYYHGTRAGFEMFPYYETICPFTDALCWTDGFLSDVQSTLYAYYEFRLFIAWYLLYAEQHESQVFNELMANQNLRVAYTLLDDLFKKQVDDYFVKRKQLVEKLTAAGNEIELSEEFLYLVKRTVNGSSSSGTGIPDDDIAYLKSLYRVNENAMLERFRVIGVNLTNYQKFLEKTK
jgi:hypothetical protein